MDPLGLGGYRDDDEEDDDEHEQEQQQQQQPEEEQEDEQQQQQQQEEEEDEEAKESDNTVPPQQSASLAELESDAPLLEKSPELGAARAESDGEEKSPTVEGDDGTALEVVSQSEDDTTTKDQHSSKRRRGSTESQKNILEMVAANDESDLALFLPKRPSGEVSELLLGRLKRFMAALEAGGSLNASLKQRKNYRNPDFLAKMVEFEGIWEYGTVFKPSQFDPVSDMANSRDSFKGLAHELRALEEKRRQERTKVEFVTGSASNPTAAAVAKAAAVAEKIVSTAPPRERERGKRVSRWD